MAGVENDMNIKTKALKVEVAHVKPPKGFDYENNAFVISDSDIGCYSLSLIHISEPTRPY